MSGETRSRLLQRLTDILYRHAKLEDLWLSDHDFIMAVHGRYLKSREEYLIDPNE